ncbi:hypothetical protein [Wukongibacter baidiensis]
MRKFLSLLLVLTLVFGAVSSSFAMGGYINSAAVKDYNDTNFTIKTLDGRTLTEEEFIEHLEKYADQIVKVSDVGISDLDESSKPTRSSNSLTSDNEVVRMTSGTTLNPGTWYIPLIGLITITYAGTVFPY